MIFHNYYRQCVFIILTFITLVHADRNLMNKRIRMQSIAAVNRINDNNPRSDDSLQFRSDLPDVSLSIAVTSLRGGRYLVPGGWNPMGYKITELGIQFLSLGDSLSCDVGRFIASLKSNRKRRATIKDSWLEIVRVSKTGQAMRIYRTVDELLDFCLKTGLVD
jgi:hypothetical protein